MEDVRARGEGDAGAGRDALRRRRFGAGGGVASDLGGGHVGYAGVGVFVEGCADGLPGGSAGEGGEGV